MFKLILWQFRYAWRQWLGTLFVLIAAGVIVAFSAIGIDSTVSANLNHGVYNPVMLFSAPLIFGALTLILIINGVVRLLINSFRDEYRLWAMLGANPNQLACLISGQMTLISLVGAVVGYLLAFPLVIQLYAWNRTVIGMTHFHSISMHLSGRSFGVTILAIGIICGLMSFLDAHRIFMGQQKHRRGFMKLTRLGVTPLRLIIIGLSTIGLLALYGLFFINPKLMIALFGGMDGSLANTYMQLFLLVTLVTMVVFSLATPINLPFIAALVFKLIPHNRLKTMNVAYWHVRNKPDFLKSVVVPLFIFSILTSFFSYLALDLANVAATRSLAEIVVTLALFLGAPFLIIFANIISITVISSPQRSGSIQQLQRLGFTFKDLLFEKCAEGLLYALILFVCGTLNNGVLFAAVLNAAQQTHVSSNSGWLSITYWPGVCALMTWLFMSVIDLTYMIKISRQK